MTIETAFETAKTTYNTKIVKLPHLLNLMNAQEKGTKLREEYGVAAALLVLRLFKDGKLDPMSQSERNLLVNEIMNSL